MKHLWPVVLLPLLLACKDPSGFGYEDPNLPDPPGPPAIVYPPDGKFIRNYGYPQDVAFDWNAVSGAESYDFMVYKDSTRETVFASRAGMPGTDFTVTFPRWGTYWWEVRAKSSLWKGGYTDWSTLADFMLPDPAD